MQISSTYLILKLMDYLLAFLIFGGSLLGMAIGLIFTRKALQKGCSVDPESCACRKEGKDPSDCTSPESTAEKP